jgi:hypothetical protein
MPEVSVVFPCYNAAAHLPRAIDSVRTQTFADVELIVVNDGSTERETLDYLASLPDDVRVIDQPNKGLPAARNAGFRAAAGKYVMPLDCDDFLDPRCLEELLAAVKEDGDASYAFSHIALCGQKTGILKRNFNFFEQLFLNHIPYCILIPKELWRRVGGYDEQMCNGLEDWEFNIRLGANGHYGRLVDKPLFFYFVRSSGMLQSMTNRQHAQLSRYIRRTHTTNYSYRSLRKVWREWHDKRTTYPLASYFGLLLMYEIFPYWLFNPAFRLLMTFSHSTRIQRTRLSGIQ